MNMESLLRLLVEQGGSDLHLMAGMPPAIRMLGELKPIADLGRCTEEQLEEMFWGLLNEEQRHTFEHCESRRNELDFSHGIEGVGRFRFNIYKQRGTLAAAVRAIPHDVPQIEDLGLPAQIKDFTKLRDGLVLVTGPTGSGKSTTLAALIGQINEERRGHIITIEEPIEYLHRSKKCYVTQREVGAHQDTLSFANALRHALRQDPDVILVGEMRDFETISIALTAAETGHLVLGTLHTVGAAQSISRIVDVFPAEQQPQVTVQLASVLRGVISQTLLVDAAGHTRTPAAEIMRVTSGIAAMIRENQIAGIYQAIETGSKDGMLTMDQCILDLVVRGKVTPDQGWPYLRTESARRKLAPMLQHGLAA